MLTPAKAAEIAPTLSIGDLSVDVLKILSTQSTTHDTADMMEVIIEELGKIPGLKIERDDYGNLYATKGKLPKNQAYPAYVCHTDTVHKIWETFTTIRTADGFYYSYTTDGDEFKQVGVGGDDKCGIILCIELLHRLKYAKCAFFLDEEQGCKGSKAGNLEFFSDCRYAIQIDRREGGDIITTGAGVELCSNEFKEKLNEVGANFAYKSTTGLSTDVVELKRRGLGISSCNLSAGYHNPHSKQEYINEKQLLNCLEFCLEISKIKEVYPHKYVAQVYTPAKHTGYYYSSTPSVDSKKSKPSNTGKCVTCNITLHAGVMCIACMRKHLYLQVYGEHKRLVIQVEEKDVVVDSVKSTVCMLCSSDMITSDEIEEGYCKNCGSCRDCGYALENHELIDGVCDICVEDGDMKCKVPHCGVYLTNRKSKEAGYCETCIHWMVDMPGILSDSDSEAALDEYNKNKYGTCTSCSDPLETSYEGAWRLCSKCFEGYVK